jgi:hypothetical protein
MYTTDTITSWLEYPTICCIRKKQQYYYTTNKDNMANITIANQYQYTYQLGIPGLLGSTIIAKDCATMYGAKNK